MHLAIRKCKNPLLASPTCIIVKLAALKASSSFLVQVQEDIVWKIPRNLVAKPKMEEAEDEWEGRQLKLEFMGLEAMETNCTNSTPDAPGI